MHYKNTHPKWRYLAYIDKAEDLGMLQEKTCNVKRTITQVILKHALKNGNISHNNRR